MKKRSLGKMRHKVKFLVTERQPDGGGGFERIETDGPLVSAMIETISAREVVRYQQLQKNVSHRVTMRRNANAKQGATLVWTTSGRVEAGNVNLYVEAVTDPRLDRPGEWIELICREGGNL